MSTLPLNGGSLAWVTFSTTDPCAAALCDAVNHGKKLRTVPASLKRSVKRLHFEGFAYNVGKNGSMPGKSPRADCRQ